MPKIRDVDSCLRENEILSERIKGVAPEICFQSHTVFPMEYSKKSSKDFIEKIEAIRTVCQLTDKVAETAFTGYIRKEVSRDDILDAVAAATTAKDGFENGFKYVPYKPEIDSIGLKIQMVYYLKENIKSGWKTCQAFQEV